VAERHQRIERWSLTDFDERGREEVRSGAGVEVEEMGSDGDTEMLLAFVLEGSVGEMSEGEVCGGLVGFGEPALMCRDGSLCHGE
jgi:hypothetical protein